MNRHSTKFVYYSPDTIVVLGTIESPDYHGSWVGSASETFACAAAAHILRMRDRFELWTQCRYRSRMPCEYMQSIDMVKGEVFTVLTSIQKGW